MTIAVILLMVFYVLIIIHHLYKIEDKLDKLDEQFKDLKLYQNHSFRQGAKWADKTMIDKACE